MNEDEVKALVSAEIAEALDPIKTQLATIAESVAPPKVEGEEPPIEEKLDKYASDLDLITEAGLTETQAAEAKSIAKDGGDVAAFIEQAKKVLTEAQTRLSEGLTAAGVPHVGGSITNGAEFGVNGFGKVR